MLFSFFSALCCKRDEQCARGTISQRRLPEKVKKDVAYYAWKYGNPKARRWTSKKYPDYTIKRKTVRDWKVKYQKAFESNEVRNFFALPCHERPSKMSNN